MKFWNYIKSLFVQRADTTLTIEVPETTIVDEKQYWSVVSDTDPNKPDKYKTSPENVAATYDAMMSDAKEKSKKPAKKKYYKKTPKKTAAKKSSK